MEIIDSLAKQVLTSSNDTLAIPLTEIIKQEKIKEKHLYKGGTVKFDDNDQFNRLENLVIPMNFFTQPPNTNSVNKQKKECEDIISDELFENLLNSVKKPKFLRTNKTLKLRN